MVESIFSRKISGELKMPVSYSICSIQVCILLCSTIGLRLMAIDKPGNRSLLSSRIIRVLSRSLPSRTRTQNLKAADNPTHKQTGIHHLWFPVKAVSLFPSSTERDKD